MRLAALVSICISTTFTFALVARAENYLTDSAASTDEVAAGDAGVQGGCVPEPCECCDCFCGKRVLGFLPSDHCFDSFISPLSNPFFFEDPRSLTEARGIFIDNNVPAQNGGGDAQVWAGQLRGRVTENVSIIAPRLGYLNVNQQGGAPQGFLSAPVGFKYNFIRDVERQFLVSAGMTYFIKGSSSTFSNFGDGDFHFFLTGGKQIFGYGHWLSASGFRIPGDSNWGTQMCYWSNQWDYELPGHIYPLVGINWYHWMRSSGLGFTGQTTGLDLINLPASGVAGRDAVTSVVGLK
ncbi:MAG TPA: hypothetical protein VGJ16_08045, partial [Pirellulales bacterium]